MKMGKRFGYSRDKRSDCVQVVVALVLTPEGFPVAYEVYPGNTRDTATLEEFLDRIEKQYGKSCPRGNGEENRSSYFCFLFGLLSPHNVAKSCAGTSRRTYVRRHFEKTLEHSND